MVEYPKRAIKALAFLFRNYNDIDVFVEDSVCRNMYEHIINRALDGKAKVRKVFQVGSKNEVLEQCRLDQAPGGRPRIYLIDGDLDLLLRKKAPKLNRLYRLRCYCAENMLFCKKAVIEVAYDASLDSERDAVESKVGFDIIIDELATAFSNLFVLYATAYSMGTRLSTSTTNYNVTAFLDISNANVKISSAKVQARYTLLKAELDNLLGKEVVETTIKKVEKLLPVRNGTKIKLFSGKTYLLPYVYNILQKRIGYSGTLRQLTVQLARHCDLQIEPNFTKTIINCASN
jgi:hypothetical protein